MKKVLILGAGFGGLETYRRLRKRLGKKEDWNITLLDEHNYFLYQPMLHEAAFGSVEPSHIMMPVREFLKNKTDAFINDRVTQILPEEKLVLTQRQRSLSYDYLVIALGSRQNFSDVPGARQYALSLKSFADAIILKNDLLDLFEQAVPDEELSFIIVGGGYTGVEIAAQAAELVRNTLSRLYPTHLAHRAHIILLHQTSRLLPALAPRAGRAALRRLALLGVEVKLEAPVKEVRERLVLLENGNILPASMILWSAGVESAAPSVLHEKYLDERGSIPVNFALQAEGMDHVFALGDIMYSARQGVIPAPKTAQAATQEARTVAKNIVRAARGKKLIAFHYFHKGDLLPLGTGYGIAQIGKRVFTGKFAWILRRIVFLFNIYKPQKRIKVSVDWLLGMFSLRDTSKIE